MRIRLEKQVVEFVRRLAPTPRRRVRAALRSLASERGDIRPLEGRLVGYYRLRVGPHRVIFAYAEGGKEIRCLYAAHRALVYETFRARLGDLLK
jgi:mRNA-degrading endonuclease RelE of RelBE toxin-antitoxin system